MQNLHLYNDSGASRGSDLETVFGNDAVVSGIASSAKEQRMTALMQRARAAFARDTGRGLTEELGWPRVGEVEASLVRMGFNNRPVAELVKPEVYGGECEGIELGADADVSETTSSGRRDRQRNITGERGRHMR